LQVRDSRDEGLGDVGLRRRQAEAHLREGAVDRRLALVDKQPKLPRVDRQIPIQPADAADKAALPVVRAVADAKLVDRIKRVLE
jgi:hypothetical protein